MFLRIGDLSTFCSQKKEPVEKKVWKIHNQKVRIIYDLIGGNRNKRKNEDIFVCLISLLLDCKLLQYLTVVYLYY